MPDLKKVVMEIKLKNIQVSDKRSEESMAFRATLYINEYKVGNVGNEGDGSPTLYYPLEEKGATVIREADAWCRTLAPEVIPDETIDGEPLSYPMNLAIYVENI